MKYLIDVNVLSEPTRPHAHPRAVEWPRRNERDLVVYPVIVGEIRSGIQLFATAAGTR